MKNFANSIKPEKTKLCILSSGHAPTEARVFSREILSLKKTSLKITIVAPHHRADDLIGGITVKGISTRKSNSLFYRFQPLIELWKKGLALEAQIYHCHEPDSLLIGYLLKHKLKCKLIYDCHEYHPEAFGDRYHYIIGWPLKQIISVFESFLARRADYIITVNDILAAKFKKLNPHVAVIPNYSRLNLYENLNGIPKKYDLVYMGVLAEAKGLFEILKTLKHLKDDGVKTKLTLIGHFSNKAVERHAMSFIEENQLGDHINLTGNMEHRQALKLMSQARIGLLFLNPLITRYTLTEPIKLFEYMGAGLAVVANDCGMIRKIVTTSKCGVLVDPQSPRKIANAVVDLLNNSPKITEMGENGKKAVYEKYNWESLEDRFLSIYSELIQ